MPYFQRVLILPIGSLEYHGARLPPDTDSIIAAKVGADLAEALSQSFHGTIRILPPINYGVSPEHSGLSDTATIAQTTFFRYVRDIIVSFSSPRDFTVLVNGHGGNVNLLAALESDFNYTFTDRKLFLPHLYPKTVKQLCEELFGEFDSHAGSVETSLLASYGLVEPGEFTVPVPKMVRGTFRFFRTAEVTDAGIIKRLPLVVSDPEKGGTVHACMVECMYASVTGVIAEIGSLLQES